MAYELARLVHLLQKNFYTWFEKSPEVLLSKESYLAYTMEEKSEGEHDPQVDFPESKPGTRY